MTAPLNTIPAEGPTAELLEAGAELGTLCREQDRRLGLPPAEREPAFEEFQGLIDAAYVRFEEARGVRLGDRVEVLEGLARHWGRPLGDVLRHGALTAVVRLCYDGSEHRVPLRGLRVSSSALIRESRELAPLPPLEAPATTPGLERPVVVIPCGGRKAEAPAPASEFYVGSYFRAALAAARAVTSEDRIRVLSGRYGFVPLGEVLEPYEQRIDAPGAVSVAELVDQAAEDELLRRVVAGELEALVFAGDAYADRAAAALGRVETPAPIATARGIGDHLAYFAALAHRAAA